MKAVDKDLVNLRRRLERWELEHLRTHAAELAERLEQAEQRAIAAENDAAAAWRWLDQMRAVELERTQADGPTSIGLTMGGDLVVVPA